MNNLTATFLGDDLWGLGLKEHSSTPAVGSVPKPQFNSDLPIPPPVLNETDNTNPRNYDIAKFDLPSRYGLP